MEMQGQRQLPVTRQHVWEALNNPDILKACIPGCTKFEADGENRYAVGVAIKIGPVAAKFAGKVELSDIQAPNGYAIGFEAQGGVAGFGKGQSKVTLSPSANGCELSYTVHSQVGGKLAQMGQRLIDTVAKSLAEDFFARFEAALKERYPVIEAAPEPAMASAGAGADGGQRGGSPAPVGGMPSWVWLAGVVGIAAVAFLMSK